MSRISFSLYLAKRLGYLVVTLWLISFIVFAVTQLLPGSAGQMILGQFATEEAVQQIEQNLGLDRPWYVQYVDWMSGILTFDLGDSYYYGQSIESIVWPRLINSVQLAVISLGLVTLVGIPLGVLAAVKRDTPLDTIISGGAYLGISVPEFVTGTFLILLFAGPIFGFLPSGGSGNVGDGIVYWAAHLVLPSVTLTVLMLAHVMRQTRTGMIETLQTEYVRTARLKGLPEKTVIVKHALRNGLLPTITVLALNFGWLMGSLVIVEEVFAYPGIGRLIVTAIQNRDIPTLQVTILIIATVYTVANLVADIVYTKLDPRIDYGGA